MASDGTVVVCMLTLDIKKRKQVKADACINWWKLTKEECCTEFRKNLRQTLGGKEELPEYWENSAEGV